MRQLVTSKFFIAVIAFGALSLLAGAVKFCLAQPTDYPYRSWTAWAIDDFLQQKKAPNVVFLGSSLVLVPLAGVDADHLNKRLDGCEHHRSLYFEEKFAQRTGVAPTSFNFALPGEMPSDAYMITNFLLKGERKPDVIVYGVGPRDFMDNLLPSPAATDPYRFLSRFGDVSAWASLMMPDWLERMSYEAGRKLYFWGHRNDIADRCGASALVALQNAVPILRSVKQISSEELHQMLPEYRPFELQRGQAFFRPSTPAERGQFTDNLAEYKRRYKKLKQQTFDTQMRFFTETLASAQRNGSRAVVVAMPITDLNRQLLSDQNWNKYKSSIAEIAARHGATYIDFNADKDFVREDFGDTVHLHSGGGRRWVDKLVERLASEPAIVTAINGERLLAGKEPRPPKTMRPPAGRPL